MLKVIGIDPASSKGLTVWDGEGYVKVKATKAASWVRELIEAHDQILICWDSPLSFNPDWKLSDRPVEKTLRKAVKSWLEDGFVEKDRSGKTAVSVQPFSGCSHWVISCEAVGQPFARKSEPIPLAQNKESVNKKGAWLIESHPAVAMLIWWLEAERSPKAMPVYKNKPNACRLIAETLGFDELVKLKELDDDILDAYVAHRLAIQFMSGDSRWIGDVPHGGFILPNSAEEKWELQKKFQKHIAV